MNIKFTSINSKIKQRIGNMLVDNLVINLFFIFIIYALVDVSWKVITHSNYEMVKLTQDIQRYFPDTRLKFQNISVVDTDSKVTRIRGSKSYYNETERLYIRNGRLCKEPNYLYVLLIIPLIIVFSVSTMDRSKPLRVNELLKLDDFTQGILMIVSVIMIVMFIVMPSDKYRFNKTKNPKAFIFEVEGIRKEIRLDDYRKK